MKKWDIPRRMLFFAIKNGPNNTASGHLPRGFEDAK
jgi:hypothetical protein